MRNRASVAVLATAAALLGTTAPAAHAADGTVVTKVVVNGGKNVSVGTTEPKTFTVSLTAQDDSGIQEADFFLNGPSYGYLDANSGVTCTEVSSTTSTCKATFTVDPRVDLVDNGPAGTWYVDSFVTANDYDYFTSEKTASFKLQRYAKLSANASPEPVRKGATLTVTGKLTRANWETGTYTGYTGQPVKLQFRRKGATAYTTVKTLTTGTGGAVKTTVKAAYDGYWRWTFAGTTTTTAATATGDYAEVN